MWLPQQVSRPKLSSYERFSRLQRIDRLKDQRVPIARCNFANVQLSRGAAVLNLNHKCNSSRELLQNSGGEPTLGNRSVNPAAAPVRANTDNVRQEQDGSNTQAVQANGQPTTHTDHGRDND